MFTKQVTEGFGSEDQMTQLKSSVQEKLEVLAGIVASYLVCKNYFYACANCMLHFFMCHCQSQMLLNLPYVQ